MDITDLLKNRRKKNKIPNKNIFAPDADKSFRMLIVGGSGGGKTMLSANLIKKYLVWDRLYLYSRHLDDENDVYEYLHEYCTKIEDKTNEKIHWMGNSIDDILDVDEYDPNYINLVLIDDMINEKNQNKIIELFTSGRHKNVSMIYLAQRYHNIPKMIRSNATHFCIFPLSTKGDIRLIANELATDFDYKEFVNMFIEATRDKFSFLYIDTTQTELCLKYRKKFDTLLMLC